MHITPSFLDVIKVENQTTHLIYMYNILNNTEKITPNEMSQFYNKYTENKVCNDHTAQIGVDLIETPRDAALFW